MKIFTFFVLYCFFGIILCTLCATHADTTTLDITIKQLDLLGCAENSTAGCIYASAMVATNIAAGEWLYFMTDLRPVYPNNGFHPDTSIDFTVSVQSATGSVSMYMRQGRIPTQDNNAISNENIKMDNGIVTTGECKPDDDQYFLGVLGLEDAIVNIQAQLRTDGICKLEKGLDDLARIIEAVVIASCVLIFVAGVVVTIITIIFLVKRNKFQALEDWNQDQNVADENADSAVNVNVEKIIGGVGQTYGSTDNDADNIRAPAVPLTKKQQKRLSKAATVYDEL